MPQHKTATLLLVRTSDESDGFGENSWTFRFTAEPVGFDAAGELYSAGWYGISVPGDLDDFQVYGWRSSRYSSDKLFARAEYRQVYSIDEQKAETMLKRMRQVNRKVRQLSEKYGHAGTAAQAAAYVAEAIGATSDQPFIRKVDAAQDFDGTGYRKMSASELAYWLADQERAWEKKHGVESAA